MDYIVQMNKIKKKCRHLGIMNYLIKVFTSNNWSRRTTMLTDIHQDRLDMKQNIKRLVWMSKGTHQIRQMHEILWYSKTTKFRDWCIWSRIGSRTTAVKEIAWTVFKMRHQTMKYYDWWYLPVRVYQVTRDITVTLKDEL